MVDYNDRRPGTNSGVILLVVAAAALVILSLAFFATDSDGTATGLENSGLETLPDSAAPAQPATPEAVPALD